MNYCLEAAVREGTGIMGDIYGHDVAAKTGSTSDYKDRWYCGYTGYYTACVWTGYDTPEPIRMIDDISNPAGWLWKKVMEPLHQDLDRLPLFDEDSMPLIEVCVESGKLATEACKADIHKNMLRVRKLRCFAEDIPTEECDKHVLVDFCTEGKGVATKYCKLFAQVTDVKFQDRGLVKHTLAELEELKKAGKFGLAKTFLRDDYIYLVTETGKPQNFFGFNNDINLGVEAPYKVCTVHTKEAWEAYQKANTPTEPATQPSTEITFPWETNKEDAA
jgi:membrane peptidoglycan carboxypeptidase